ncbi:MAG TPA: HAMP domain-containing sensor histidine kinase [Terriglobales bacterium]|nr:HAMP domain-containing sensor histidine kinase [Terriglobales bacterium]
MNLLFKDKVLSSAGVVVLIAILALLAALQYRWSQELNDAASDRMRAGLHSSMIGLREDLNRELSSLSLAVQSDSRAPSGSMNADDYIERLDAWKRTASHPALVSEVFIWDDPAGSHPRLLHLNVAKRGFEPSEWPLQFSRVQQPLRTLAAEMTAFAPSRSIIEGQHPAGFGRTQNRFIRPELPWMIEETVPALLHPQVVSAGTTGSAISWIIIELNPTVLQQQVFPELAQRYFGGKDGLIYDVAVMSGVGPNRLFYTSNSQFGSGTNIPTDGRMNLFGPPNSLGDPRNMPFGAVRAREDRGPAQRDWRIGHVGLIRLEPFRRTAAGGDWEIIVKHRKGSLESVLALMRLRHLGISFGVLLLLAVTLAMIIVTTRRAQRLAKLQMDFVAGVSHELRTPLAVIGSAADNIADGIIEDKKKLVRYGTVIRDQSKQLSRLVEQILLFAATRQDRYQYAFTRVQVSEIIEAALADSAEIIRAAGFTVEREIEPELPRVSVDVIAVSHCLQNLIANAVKYGGDQRWIGVRAYLVEERRRDREVQIRVEDRGIGIDSADLQRIFDPFYRSPAVVSAQIHGTGLGLALARRIAEAMGGKLSLTSEPGKGSCFVLHLPCSEEQADSSRHEVADTVASAMIDSQP